MLVKTCGIQTVEAAEVAVANGVDLLGVILVPNRSRTVDFSVAKQIAHLARNKRLSKKTRDQSLLNLVECKSAKDSESYYLENQRIIASNGPYLVGVFQNQSVEEIINIVHQTNIDIVQLHGSENKLEYVEILKNHGIPVISRYLVDDLTKTDVLEKEILVTNHHLLVLLDSEKGGDGKTLNWDSINRYNQQSKMKFILAGGLNCENVVEAITSVKGVIGVDVSSGIETNKVKDPSKIEQFIKNVRLSS